MILLGRKEGSVWEVSVDRKPLERVLEFKYLKFVLDGEEYSKSLSGGNKVAGAI